MVHFHLRNGSETPPTDAWEKWLLRAIMVGLLLVELAAVTWIVYKIVSPKY